MTHSPFHSQFKKLNFILRAYTVTLGVCQEAWFILNDMASHQAIALHPTRGSFTGGSAPNHPRLSLSGPPDGEEEENGHDDMTRPSVPTCHSDRTTLSRGYILQTVALTIDQVKGTCYEEKVTSPARLDILLAQRDLCV